MTEQDLIDLEKLFLRASSTERTAEPIIFEALGRSLVVNSDKFQTLISYARSAKQLRNALASLDTLR